MLPLSNAVIRNRESVLKKIKRPLNFSAQEAPRASDKPSQCGHRSARSMGEVNTKWA
jgi:hypothetical protein